MTGIALAEPRRVRAPLTPPLVCALMGLGLVYGPLLPDTLGYPEAAWDRLASLTAAALPTALLLVGLRPDAPWRHPETLLALLLIAALVALGFGAQWATPAAASHDEALVAAKLYAAIYVALQLALIAAWALWGWESAETFLTAGEVRLTPVLGLMLASVGTYFAIDAHFLAVDPHLTGPWQEPWHPAKLQQVGAEMGVRMERVMAWAACLPLLWWATRWRIG